MSFVFSPLWSQSTGCSLHFYPYKNKSQFELQVNALRDHCNTGSESPLPYHFPRPEVCIPVMLVLFWVHVSPGAQKPRQGALGSPQWGQSWELLGVSSHRQKGKTQLSRR